MKRIFGLTVLLAVLSVASAARSETLSWDPVTKFTDGSSIPAGAVTYTAYWTTDATLATGLKPLAPASSDISVAFDPDAAGMPRGAIIYLTCKATVAGVDSNFAVPLSWNVPVKTPDSPANLRLN